MRALAKHLVTHTPWSFVSSVSAGFGNYFLVVLLARFYTPDAVGEFRLLLSAIGMLALFSVFESGKILLRSVVEGNIAIARPLFYYRLRWSMLGVVAGWSYAAWLFYHGNALAIPVLIATAAAPFYYGADLYDYINQARSNFRTNAIYNSSKILIVLSFFATGGILGVPTTILFSGYFVILASCHSLFFWLEMRGVTTPPVDCAKAKRKSLFLSISTVPPLILEHTDKLLIGLLMGIKPLGYYTVAVSTGRLVLYGISPLLTTINPLLVRKKVPGNKLVYVFIGFTILGILTSYFIEIMYLRIYPAEYHQYFHLSKVIIWGVGLYCTYNLLYSSAVFHQDAALRIPMISNWISPAFIFVWLGASMLYGGDNKLLLCALSYPLRHLVGIVTITLINYLWHKSSRSKVA